MVLEAGCKAANSRLPLDEFEVRDEHRETAFYLGAPVLMTGDIEFRITVVDTRGVPIETRLERPSRRRLETDPPVFVRGAVPELERDEIATSVSLPVIGRHGPDAGFVISSNAVARPSIAGERKEGSRAWRRRLRDGE